MDDDHVKLDIMKDNMFCDASVGPLDSKFQEKDEDYKESPVPLIEGMKKEVSAPPKSTIINLNSFKRHAPVVEDMKKEISAPSKSALLELVKLKR